LSNLQSTLLLKIKKPPKKIGGNPYHIAICKSMGSLPNGNSNLFNTGFITSAIGYAKNQ